MARMADAPKQAPLHADHGGAFFEAIGVDFGHLERRRDIVNADVLDAWYDPSPRVVEALQAHLPWLLRTSPPTHGEGLVAAIAASRGLDPETILIGAGTSALMYQALPRLLRQGGRVAMPDPTYGEYPHLVENVLGARWERDPTDPTSGWKPDLEALAAASKSCDLVILVNPNSPTGAVVSTEWIKVLLDRMPPETRLWVDETYVDFAEGRPTIEALVEKDPRLIVAKSLSKFYGLSGVRVGYLAMEPNLRAKLAAESPPWPVGLVGQVAAVAALADQAYYEAKANETRVLAKGLFEAVAKIGGLRPYQTAANFLLVQLEVGTSSMWTMAMREAGVFVRDCTSISPLLKDRFIRIAVKDAASNARIVVALQAVGEAMARENS